jgi:hypothetical protein
MTFKSFEQPTVPAKILPTFLGISDGCSTPIAESVRAACERILRRPEPRKVIIIMSDGGADDLRDAKAVIQVGRDLGVEMYGYGMMDMSIKGCFPDHEKTTVIAFDPVELPVKLAQLIQRITLRQG